MDIDVKEKIVLNQDRKLSKGYRNTSDNHFIPNDWEEKKLSEIAIFKNGKAHEQVVSDNGDYVLVTSKFIATDGKEFRRSVENLSPLKKGDIAMVLSDVPNGRALAKCFFTDKDNKYTLNQRICSLTAKKGQMNPVFLYYFLNRNSYFLRFDNGVGQTNLRKDEVLQCPVLQPPIIEQEKIACIITTWDKAIELKEKLIEQKKEQKKGLMQKLLTGEVRLPGFDGEWKHIKLGKFVKLQGGFAFKSSEFKQEGIPIIRISNIVPEITDTNQEFVYYDEIDGLSESFKVNFGDILIAMSGATTGKVGLYKKNEFAYLNQRVGKFVNLDGSKLDYSFLYYLVKSSMFKLQLKEELATGAQPNISSKQIERFNFKIPPLDEQKGISNILNQIDKSIFLLEKEVDLLTQQKKGLMQLLLTGKIRVQV